MLEAGAQVPDVGAQDQNGHSVKLRDFKGRKLVVYFYPKADTPGCTAESQAFRDLKDDLNAAGADIVGVSRDTVDAQKKFADKYALNFPLLGGRVVRDLRRVRRDRREEHVRQEEHRHPALDVPRRCRRHHREGVAAGVRRGPRRRRARGSPIALTATARLTVAGSSSSIPRPDRACSSYLVDDGETPIVMDLGTGAFANLRRHADYDRLGAVVISHMHADHFIDLIPLRYALKYGPRRRAAKLPVYLPPGGLAMLRAFVAAFPREPGAFLDDVFALHEYDPSQPLAIEGATLRFAHTAHYIPAFAMRWERDGASVTYSADTAPDERVVALARESRRVRVRGDAAARRRRARRARPLHRRRRGRDGARRAASAGWCCRTTARSRRRAISTRPRARVFGGEIIVADDHHTVDLGG